MSRFRCAALMLMSWMLPATALAQQAFLPEQITSVATGHLTGEKDAPDVAMLVAPSPDSDADYTLVILSPRDGGWEGDLQVLATYENAVWGGVGEIVGNKPSVSFSPAGSLLLHSHNEAIGRNRWTQILTLAWRDGALVVAGFTWSEYDTLDPEASMACDVNLLAGKAELTRNGATAKVEPGPRRLTFEGWLAEGSPNLCPSG